MNRLPTAIIALFLWIGVTVNAYATSSLLVDLESGQPILSEHPDVSTDASGMLPLVISYAALDQLGDADILNKSVPNPWYAGKEKQEITLYELFAGLLMTGDPRAVTTLLAVLGVSSSEFDRQISETIERNHLTQTTFSVNCLTSSCISSASDMAQLAKAFYEEHPVARIWGATQAMKLPDGTTLTNNNFFLANSSAIVGIYASASPENDAPVSAVILSENPKGNGQRLRKLLSVALNVPNSKALREQISSLMLRGYRDYETLKIYDKGQFVALVPIFKSDQKEIAAVASRSVFVTMTTEQMLTSGAKALELRVRYSSPLVAPIKAGTQIGELDVITNQKLVATVPVVALESVAEGGFWRRFKDSVRLALSHDALHQ